MIRRSRGAALSLLLVCGFCITLAGCETLHHSLRSKDADPEVKNASAETTGSDADKVLDVKSDSKQAKPFFRPSRLSGGWSSEAREIEADMGITH